MTGDWLLVAFVVGAALFIIISTIIHYVKVMK